MSPPNPLKQAAHFKALEQARSEADKVAKAWWDEWKGGNMPSQSSLNSVCRTLDSLAPGEGARLEAMLALNALADLQRKFKEQAEESASIRTRLVALEKEKAHGQDIIRRADAPFASGESSSLPESSGESIRGAEQESSASSGEWKIYP